MIKRLSTWIWVAAAWIAMPALATTPYAFVQGGELRVSPDLGQKASTVSLPFEVVTSFGTIGDEMLVGAEQADVPPNSDAWGGINLWAVSADGEARQLTFGRRVLSASWSEEAQLIAYWTRNMRIFVTDSDARETRRIIDRGASPAFSPDGSAIAFSKPSADWRPGSLVGSTGIHVYDLETGEARQLTSGFDDSEPFWTPDGRTILFLSGTRTGLTSLWKVPVKGGSAQQLTNVGLTSAREDGFVPNPSRNTAVQWSPDGSAILFGASYSEAGEVVVIDMDDRHVATEARIVASGRSPVWSPDGSILVPGAERAGKVQMRSVSPQASADVEVISISESATSAPEPPALSNLAAQSSSCTEERFRWPLASHPTSSSYYYYDNNNTAGAFRNWKCSTTTQSYDQHRGTDIPVGCGTAVYSGAAGTVSARNDGCPDVGSLDPANASYNCGGGFGNYVKIDHGNSWFSVYAHMKNGTPRALGAVGCGIQVGQSCSSGRSSGNHLHFEVQRYAAPGNDPFSGSCSGTVSFWCSQGTGNPSMTCCCS